MANFLPILYDVFRQVVLSFLCSCVIGIGKEKIGVGEGRRGRGSAWKGHVFSQAEGITIAICFLNGANPCGRCSVHLHQLQNTTKIHVEDETHKKGA